MVKKFSDPNFLRLFMVKCHENPHFSGMLGGILLDFIFRRFPDHGPPAISQALFDEGNSMETETTEKHRQH